MILVLDNRDSFVHNLARYVRLAGQPTEVVRSDEIDIPGVEALQPDAIVLSPGPGEPSTAGCCIEVVQRLHQRLPMLGVCLGCQAIAEAFGARIARAPEAVHGRTSRVTHTSDGLFAGLESPLTLCRYHSLAVDEDSLPTELVANAWDEQRVVMAIAHRELPVFGVQFHPEAILTEGGSQLIQSFVTGLGG